VDLGLAHPEPESEARRNVLVSPLIGLDPDLDPATFDLARMLDDLLARSRDFAALPGKFGIVVDGGGALPVAESPGDILVQPQGDLVLISLDGGELAANVALDDVRNAIKRIIAAFLADGTHRRMRDADAAVMFSKAGLTANMPRRPRPSRSPIGTVPGAIGIGLPFGMLHADTLRHLADLATQHGDATLRLTPWRALLLPGMADMPPPDAAWITELHDPRLRIEACPGAPFCAAATVSTLDAAREMAAHAHWDGLLHISGCAKGCAHRGVANLTLVGEDGAWNVIRDAAPNATPLLRRRTIGSIAAETPQRTI
jgi:precorrin-3B synthase